MENLDKKRNTMFEWAESLIISIFSVVLIFIFVIRPVGVDGESMLPTLNHGDKLLISNLFFEPDYGDIVVLTKASFSEQSIVKRVIATEGQTVDIDFKSGEVFINGEKLHEDYINEQTYLAGDTVFPLTVPEGHVFVMGDNRNHSSDSRNTAIGLINKDLILGKVVLRFLPSNDFGKVE